MPRLRSPLFSGVCSRITGCFAPDKPFRRFKMIPTCRLEKSRTNHPLRRVETQMKGDFDCSVPKCARRCTVVTVLTYLQTDTFSYNETDFILSGISYLIRSCEIPRVIKLRRANSPPPANPAPTHRNALNAFLLSSPEFILPPYTRSTEWAFLPLSLSLYLSLWTSSVAHMSFKHGGNEQIPAEGNG